MHQLSFKKPTIGLDFKESIIFIQKYARIL